MKNQKISWLAKAVYAAAAILAVAPTANAMHIMEGYLPPAFCIAWGIVCLPFLVLGFRSLNRRVQENRRSITLIAMAGAFVFVLSSLKIPSVTGSCSHMTGTGLGAILFGPCAVSVLGIIVLIFQAVLLAHGGLTTLGANCFSMAIAGPILSWLIYKVVPFFAKKGAEFGGSDDAGSVMVEEIKGEAYEPWFTPVIESLTGSELPGEIESLIFCVQTGIGVGVIAFLMGRFYERKKWEDKEEEKK